MGKIAASASKSPRNNFEPTMVAVERPIVSNCDQNL